jgi:hypothetical protein
MEVVKEKDEKSIKVPETIHDNLFFEMKVFYGLVITAYVAAGILIVVG